ncbi:MAG: carboxypeptidase-like regulatory domain-containing protein [Methylocella sp.]
MKDARIARLCGTMVVTSLWFGSARVAGRLEGIVISPGGAPVAGALVQAADMTRPSIGIFPQAYSGRDGRFKIEGFRGGAATVTFFAGEPEDFYPGIPSDFYGTRSPTTARTDANGSVSGVRVYLAPQCGRLEGTVTDQETGVPVPPQIDMWRAGHARAYFGTSGDLAGGFEALVPTVPVVVYIHALGYEPWYYPGTSVASKATPLVIRARQTIVLKIVFKKQRLQ